MAKTLDDFLEQGRDAFRRRAWQEAFELFSAADDAQPLSPSDLEDLGEAAWWLGRLDDTIAAHERAFNLLLAQGERTRAGYMAVLLTRHHFWKAQMSVAMGWKAQVERLLADAPDCVEKGWAIQLDTVVAQQSGSAEEALAHAERALLIAEKFGDPDLRVVSLQDKAIALVGLGRLSEGLALLDEASVASRLPAIRPLVTGIVYCRSISVCASIGDWRRAGEITEAATRWCEKQTHAGGFPGLCQVHRAEVIRIRGDFAGAERAARTARDRWERSMAGIAADASYEIGEIRLRRGDLAGAEEAFQKAFELSRDPHPGMAMLRLVQGRIDAAVSSIKRALAATSDALQRARLLPTGVTVAVQAGDVDEARRAAEELRSIADRYATAALDAAASCAEGEVRLAKDDFEGALGCLRASLQLWQQVDAPYEAATVRTLMGRAYRGLGDEDAALMEFGAARSTFERLGATRDAAAVAEMLGTTAGPVAGSRVAKTFMFTDIVGSTTLVEALGDEAWRDLLAWHDQTLRSLFAEHGGEEVKTTGDGFFVAFEEAAEAVECAVAIQRKLLQHRKDAGFAPQVRIGLHTTEATLVGLDYEGRGVHVAARIGARASAGQILAGRDVVLSGTRRPASDPEPVRLKGISAPVEVVEIDWR